MPYSGACPARFLAAFLQVLIQGLAALTFEHRVEAGVRPVPGCKAFPVGTSEGANERIASLMPDLTILVAGTII